MAGKAELPNKARAVVIGGGVIGCSIAYHLTKIGWSDVVLLENKKPVILEQAIEKRNEILASYFPQHVSDEADIQVRNQFPIKLSREAIGRS